MRKKKKNKPEALPQRHNWVTSLRADDTPSIDTYHFVAEAGSLIPIKKGSRPLVAINDGIKMAAAYSAHFSPSLVDLFGMHLASKVWVWRVPRRIYPNENAFMAEIMQAGEIVCWFPMKDFRDDWIKRKMAGSDTMIVLAFETENRRGGSTILEAFAAFYPEWIAFVPGAEHPPVNLRRMHKISERTDGLLKVCDVTVITNTITESGGFSFASLGHAID